MLVAPSNGFVGGQFGIFIALCGMTHLLSALSADSALSVFKIMTAIIFFITALTSIVLIPHALQLLLQVASLDEKYTTREKVVYVFNQHHGLSKAR